MSANILAPCSGSGLGLRLLLFLNDTFVCVDNDAYCGTSNK